MGTEHSDSLRHFMLTDAVNYASNAVTSKTLLKKLTGTITLFACDAGQTLTGKTLPFDSFIQVIEGSAQVTIASTSFIMKRGQAIIVPAHAHNSVFADVPFKMLSTVIKSGYEEESIH